MSVRKILSIAALSAVGALLSLPAQAHEGRVQWGVQIGLPLPPLPVPVITLPVPRVIVAPAYNPPPAWNDRDRDGIPDGRDRYDNRRHGHRDGYGYGYGRGYGDRDRDGVPNRYDRRDDRLDAPGWGRGPDRDRDGVPDWRDRYDNRR